MKQCKLCGIPFIEAISAKKLKEHWQRHHRWHWQKNQELQPEDALLKKR